MVERTIVQYGVYQFDDQEKRAYRLRLMAQVLRHPDTEYQNLKYQKYKGFYGYAQLMNGDFVHQVVPIEFEKQCIFEYFAHDNLNTLYNSALQLGTLQTISNAVQTLGGGGLVIIGSTLPFFPMPYDRVVVRLHSNTTLLLFTEVITLPDLGEVPQQFDDGSAEPTPTSPSTAEPNPLDEGYDIPSNPYDPLTDDNGESYDPERPVVQPTGTFLARITFTQPLYGSGQFTFENILTDPQAAPVREDTVQGNSHIVALRWYYGSSGQYWQIDYTSAGADITDQIQIISHELIPQ